ncbi:MAG: exsH [Phenylobacterium sp.]|nr:exsH [Phenylobacterium sp.]
MSLSITQILDDAPDGASGVVNGQTIGDSTPGVVVQLAGSDAAAGTSLTLYSVGASGARQALQTLTVGSDTSYVIFRPSALAEASYTFEADSANAASNPFAVTVDLTPDAAPLLVKVIDDVQPDGPFSGPDASTSRMINDSTPVLEISLAGTNASAGDQLKLFSKQPTQVQFTHTVTAAEAQNGYVDLTPTLTDGWYQFQSQLTHADGSFVGASNVRGVRVDTVAPVAPQITAVHDDAGATTGDLASGGSTDDTTPTVTVTFDLEQPPAGPGSPGHNPYPPSSTIQGTVQLFANGTLVGSAYAQAGPATITTSALAPGQYALTARNIDTSGNVGAMSAPFTLTVTSGDPAPADGAGQVLTSHQYADSLVGGAGNDTLVAGQGPDTLTGNGGADVFTFKDLPWNAGHTTDFTVGADRLDLTALFQASGYTGSNPVADGYVSLQSDGVGGTEVCYDTDGPAPGNAIQFRITDLDHVSPTGLTWAQLSGGTSGAGATPGQTLTSSQYADTLTGGAGADTLNAGQGPDQLTGGAGPDSFVFGQLPWNAGHITDFTPGADRIDLRQIFQAAGYSGADPITDHYLEFRSDGAGDTQVYVDVDGPSGSQWPFLITTLDHVTPSQIGAGDWLFR